MNSFPLRITTAMLLAVACSSGKPTAELARQPTRGEGAIAVSRSTDGTDAAPVPTTKPEAAAQGVFPAADEYRIDGETVGRKAFEALRAELEIDKEPDSTADIVNEDGSYGGSEASFRAKHKPSGAMYWFTEVSFAADGKSSTLHSIQTK